MEQQPRRRGSSQIHGEAADQVVEELRTLAVRDQHDGEEGDQRREQHAVEKDHEAGALQILQLGMRDLTVNLCEGLLAAHGQQRVAKPYQHHYEGHACQGRSGQPAERIGGEPQVGGRGEGNGLVSAGQDGDYAPDDEDCHHYGGHLHDAQGLPTRFAQADDVLTPEIQRHDGGEDRGEVRRVDVNARVVKGLPEFVNEAADVQPRADAADGAGQDVVEHQRRDGKFGQRAAHGFMNHAIDAAAHEHAATLDVDGADGVREQHDRQDEPGRGFSDGVFGDAAGVVRGGCEVAEDDGGRPPERNEGQHDGGGDHDLGRPRRGLDWHGEVLLSPQWALSNSPARLADGLGLESTPSL